MSKSLRTVSSILTNLLASSRPSNILLSPARLNDDYPYFGTDLFENLHVSSKDHFYVASYSQLDKINAQLNFFVSSHGVSSILLGDLETVEDLMAISNDRPIYLVTDLLHYFSSARQSFTFLHDNFIHIDSRQLNDDFLNKMINSQLDALPIFWKCVKSQIPNDSYAIFIIDSEFGDLEPLIASFFHAYLMKSLVISSQIFQVNQSNRIDFNLHENNQFALNDDDVKPPALSLENESSRTLPYFKDNYLWKGKISAVINLYRRIDAAVEIYNQLLKQTYPVSKIIIWTNEGICNKELLHIRECMPKAYVIFCEENLGVWSRFSYALNNSTEYTVIFDDDTIPGTRWLENCVSCMLEREALYGTVGLKYNSTSHYMDHRRFGWPNPNEYSVVTDIVGHSWFFKTEWLKEYWFTKDDINGLDFCGEDMHFSYALQKLNIPTIVPPHPITDKSLWGSLKGFEMGTGNESISMSGQGSLMDYPLQRLIKRGFKLINH